MKKKVSCALVSVSDKTGIVDFCRELNLLDIEILSTGGTAKILAENQIKVTEVADYTGFPEMMDGRVKTLHPKIHGGILGRRGLDDRVMKANDIKPIDLVVVNLYPFENTIAKPDCIMAEAIENIDIGGPAMLRAAAKNYIDVAVIVDPLDYGKIIAELKENKNLALETRFNLAAKCFQHTAHYDTAIAAYLGKVSNQDFPEILNLQYYLSQTLRYGENPHQKAAFFSDYNPISGTIGSSRQLQGKELSYNNIADADAALECVKAFTDRPACVIVKHANPCGVAEGDTLLEAYNKAYSTDPTSAFGGIIAFNQELDKETASEIINRQFVEVIVAPTHLAMQPKPFWAKNPSCGYCSAASSPRQNKAVFNYKNVSCGLLVQEQDSREVREADLLLVTKRAPTAQEHQDMLFAWKVAKYVKSNAIVYAQEWPDYRCGCRPDEPGIFGQNRQHQGR